MKLPYNYSRYAWKQFRKNKPALVSFYIFILFLIIALFSDFIANRQPLYAKYRGQNFYPVFQTLFHKNLIDSTLNPATRKYEKLQFDITDWRELALDKVIWPPIPYSASQKDKSAMSFVSPAAEQHYKNYEGKTVLSPGILKHHLGTNIIGEDVAAGLVHGTSIALRVGLGTMAIAAFFGILLGASAGYFGDNKIVIRRGAFLMALPGLFFGYFYGFVVRKSILIQAFKSGFVQSMVQILLSFIILLGLLLFFIFAGRIFNKIGFFKKKVVVPVDIFISRFIEIFDSIPSLLLVITISSVFVEKSLAMIILIIGILAIPSIARITRAEFMRIRNQEYVQSAMALGFRDGRIMFRHILPNALAPVFVYIAFGIASAIIAESSLSFLGIGVPADTVTWGSLLSASREDYTAWWMAVFPGLAIFITVTTYNLIGEGLRDALDPKMKI